MTQLPDLTVTELAAAIRTRELSPVAITGHYLDRIEAVNARAAALDPRRPADRRDAGRRMGGEGTLISLAARLEAARPWRDRHPALW